MLFEPARHEPLTQAPWSESAARDAISRIAIDAQRTFTVDGLWPLHPMDRSPERAAILKPIYYGAAGVIWALDELARAGLLELERDYSAVLGNLLDAHRADSLRLHNQPVLGYPLGDAGILLLHWKLAPSEKIAQALHRVITANAAHPALGFAWGGAGTMLAALFMFERTGDDRWRDLYLSNLDALWALWAYEPRVGCHLWMTDLYGSREQRMNALHGLPGIVHCMLRGIQLLDPDRQRALVERARICIEATALRDGASANWPLSVGDVQGPGTEVLRVQHCIGAPGIVNCLSALPPEPGTDALLEAAGELTWLAGPLVKLPSLCHGVPGNGFAFLKLFRRTGETRWLERARRFAMHAIEQEERCRLQYGQRKYSLWTGHLGLALYLWKCITADAEFPTLDYF